MIPLLSLCLLFATTVANVAAVNVYLSPARPFATSTLSPEDASAALSRHLGLEDFEPLRDMSNYPFDDESFVGQGAKHAVVVTVPEDDADGEI